MLESFRSISAYASQRPPSLSGVLLLKPRRLVRLRLMSTVRRDGKKASSNSDISVISVSNQAQRTHLDVLRSVSGKSVLIPKAVGI